ncbi:MAG: four helix bundle protein [Kiritimatiellae bacterium]|jgi:four helix bundle protein|nr:four helix bundle protein [Kiritimatiellia bacterium]
MAVLNVKELTVYKKSYKQAMLFFKISKCFPAEERYALTSQGRRSSRSVPMNLREAWAKRRYIAHFVSKVTDCDGENAETETSIDFAYDCGYITVEEYKQMLNLNHEVGKMLGVMLNTPEKYVLHIDP